MEFSRLLGNRSVDDVLYTPIALATQYAHENRVVLLLKGASTVVTDGEEILLVDRGCPGMATAGSGDVLSGVLAALFGYAPTSPVFTTAAGAFICGYAGELAEGALNAITMTAKDTVRHIRTAILHLTE
jgi:NAD(P)H-hydrate epimerase